MQPPQRLVSGSSDDMSDLSAATVSSSSSLYEPFTPLFSAMTNAAEQGFKVVLRTCDSTERFARNVGSYIGSYLLPPVNAVLALVLPYLMPLWAFAVEYVKGAFTFLSALCNKYWNMFTATANEVWEKLDIEARLEELQAKARQMATSIWQFLNPLNWLAAAQEFAKEKWEAWAMEEKLVALQAKVTELLQAIWAKLEPYWTALQAKVAPYVPSPVQRAKQLATALWQKSAYPTLEFLDRTVVAPARSKAADTVARTREGAVQTASAGVARVRKLPLVTKALAIATPFGTKAFELATTLVLEPGLAFVRGFLNDEQTEKMDAWLAWGQNWLDAALVFIGLGFAWAPAPGMLPYSVGVSFATVDDQGFVPAFTVSRRVGRPVTVAVENNSEIGCQWSVSVDGRPVPALQTRVEGGTVVQQRIPDDVFERTAGRGFGAPEFQMSAVFLADGEQSEAQKMDFTLAMAWDEGKKKLE